MAGMAAYHMEFEQIAYEGLPPRPAFLLRPPDDDSSSAQRVARLLWEGKTVVVGGISLIGADMYVVPIISVLRLPKHHGMLHGWALAIGHPVKALAFDYFDVSKGQPADFMPNAIVYFIGETEERFASEDAPEDALIAIARFVFPFISDEGPPKDIDW